MSLGTENGLSASDVALLSGNRNGGGAWNGEWLIALIVLFMFPMMFGRNGMWGNGNDGNGGGGVNTSYIPYASGVLTRSDLCAEFNANDLQNAVRGIQQGICDSTFALNNSINTLGTNMMQGFNTVNQGLCSLGYNVQQGFNATQMAMMQGQNAMQMQLADCCCKTNNNIERGFADVGYRMATDTCAITTAIANSTRDTIDNQNANSRAILDALNQNYIRTLESENQSLKLSASQAAQNATLMAAMDANKAEILRRTGAECPSAAYLVNPPTTVNFPTNCCGQVAFGGNHCGGCGSYAA